VNKNFEYMVKLKHYINDAEFSRAVCVL